MQKRIEDLEELVKKLISERQELAPRTIARKLDNQDLGAAVVPITVSSDAPNVEINVGTTVVNGIHSIYKGVGDWHDVLKEVSHHLYLFSLSLFQFS